MTDTKQLTHYIDGQWVAGSPASDSLNPSDTRDVVAKVPGGDKKTVDSAVAAAKAAFPAWAKCQPRSALGPARQGGLADHGRAPTTSAACCHAKKARPCPRARAKSCAPRASSSSSPGEALRRHGVTVESTRPGVAVETYREPLGVFGLITPWNFPIAFRPGRAAPALAFGNTVVMKPASLTPATAHALTEIIHEAGCPRVCSISILGGGSMGGALSEHPTWRRMSFTGGQSTGATVAKGAMSHNARVQLEMAARIRS
jgi:aldehyde dehydrogenase (NAD+)